MARDKNGKLQKGHTGLKPKGAVSQKTKDWKEMGEFVKDGLVPLYVRITTKMMQSKDPEEVDRGMEKLLHILEYFQPKLGRTELVGADGKDLNIKVVFEDVINVND